MGGFDVDRIIERDEGLQGSVGTIAAEGADFSVRSVERRHGRVGVGSAPDGIEGSTVSIFTGGRFPVGFATEGGGEARGGLLGSYRFAEHFVGEETAEGEGLIANFFGAETEAWSAPEVEIFGIDFIAATIGFGALSIGGGGHDLSDDVFDIPLLVEEFEGEIVEQFGMGWEIALRAEFFGGADQADAEEGLPKSIGEDSVSERVIGLHEPLGEIES